MFRHSIITRAFHSSFHPHDFHFDTHHFVQRLEREGLTRAQSEGIMASMSDVIDESLRNLSQSMVTKAQQEKVCLLPLLATMTADISTSSITLRKWTSPSSNLKCSSLRRMTSR